MKEKMNDFCVQRLEKLKQEVLLDYLSDIDLDNPKSLYDAIMKNLFSGKLEDLFLSESLKGLSQEQRKEVFQLARNYQTLCFYKGDFSYWADSIDGVYLSDLELVAIKVLDNYEFLLRLARNVGENVLKQMLFFQNSPMSNGGSVVNFLRNTFEDDDILEKTLIEMSDKDGIFKDLDNTQKRIICSYPEGIIYHIRRSKHGNMA